MLNHYCCHSQIFFFIGCTVWVQIIAVMSQKCDGFTLLALCEGNPPVMHKVFGGRNVIMSYDVAGLILGLRPANERQCYIVTASLIGWVQA